MATAFSFDEVSNFTQYASDTMFGTNKCNKPLRIQFTCKRKQMIEKLRIYLMKNDVFLLKLLDTIIENEGMYVYERKRSAAPVTCAVTNSKCYTFDEIYFSSPTESQKFIVRTDITDLLTKLHTFVHWQSFVTCVLYTNDSIDHSMLYENFSVLHNFISALVSTKFM